MIRPLWSNGMALGPFENVHEAHFNVLNVLCEVRPTLENFGGTKPVKCS